MTKYYNKRNKIELIHKYKFPKKFNHINNLLKTKFNFQKNY